MSTAVTVQNQRPVDPLMLKIVEAAGDPNVDAAKMRAMWELYRDMETRSAEVAFNEAMQQVQEAIKPVVRSSEGATNRYARLEVIDRGIRPIYTKHGFSPTYSGKESSPGMLTIMCDLMHSQGHVKHYELPSKLDAGNRAKSDIQAVGSTVTYLRRYLICMIFNVMLTDDPDDNDGVETIDLKQKNQLLDLLTQFNVKGAETSLCKSFKVSKLEEIPAFQFDTAVSRLNQAIRDKAAK